MTDDIMRSATNQCTAQEPVTVRTHRDYAHTFLFGNPDDLKRRRTQFEAPSESNALGSNPLFDLS